MSQWAYTDHSKESIYRLLPDGAMESLSALSLIAMEIIASGVVADPPAVSADEIQLALTDVLNAHLDSVAGQRRYDSRFTCALRAGFPGPFQAEGLAFAAFMDACNMVGYTMMKRAKAGEIPVPTDAELIAAMPAMVWPQSPIPEGAV